MNQVSKSLSGIQVQVVTLVIALALSAVACGKTEKGAITAEQGTPQDFEAQMNEYAKQGRYEDAIRAGLKALRNTPHDAAVHGQIAIVYLARAAKEADKDRWASEAVSHLESAISKEAENPIVLLDAARGFESAGDLSGARKCEFYLRSKEVSQTLDKLLATGHIVVSGEQYSIDSARNEFVARGHTFRIQPLRDEAATVSLRLKEKISRQKCTMGGAR